MAYATDTEVPVEKSRAEIERVLQRYGANQFAYMSNERAAIVCFVARGKMVKFYLPLPDRNSEALTHYRPGGGYSLVRLAPDKAVKKWEQACRSRWRALCLCVKAKLEAVDSGITSFEAEFLAHFVVPGGKTFGETAIPMIEEATKTGRMPQLELMGGPTP